MVTRSQSTLARRQVRQSSLQAKAVVSTTSPAALIPKPARAIKKTVSVDPHVDATTLKKATSETPPAATGLKVTKPKKAKMVRDSFTMPKVEYTVIDELKQRAMALSHAAKKSELIRAGIKALAQMSDAEFLIAMAAVPAIKTGRPLKAVIV
jgi:hypothetical protein